MSWRRGIRIAAVLVGFCLMWPGTWGLIAISNNSSIDRTAQLPLFDRVGIWVLVGSIWGAAISLVWFGTKKGKTRESA